MAKVSVLDLTVAQVSAIERAINVPMNRWGSDVVSMADLYSRILSAVTGRDLAEFEAMTMKQIVDMVTLDGAADPS